MEINPCVYLQNVLLFYSDLNTKNVIHTRQIKGWYILSVNQSLEMLVVHGQKGAGSREVHNTCTSFLIQQDILYITVISITNFICTVQNHLKRLLAVMLQYLTGQYMKAVTTLFVCTETAYSMYSVSGFLSCYTNIKAVDICVHVMKLCLIQIFQCVHPTCRP